MYTLLVSSEQVFLSESPAQAAQSPAGQFGRGPQAATTRESDTGRCGHHTVVPALEGKVSLESDRDRGLKNQPEIGCDTHDRPRTSDIRRKC